MRWTKSRGLTRRQARKLLLGRENGDLPLGRQESYCQDVAAIFNFFEQRRPLSIAPVPARGTPAAGNVDVLRARMAEVQAGRRLLGDIVAKPEACVGISRI